MANNSHNNQFQIELPKGWEDKSVHYFQGPVDRGVQHGLSLVIDPKPNVAKLDLYARERIDNAVGSLPEAEVVKEESSTTPDGVDMLQATLRYQPVPGTPQFQRMYFVKRGKAIYQFSATFSKQTIKTIAVDVDRIIASFQPIEE